MKVPRYAIHNVVEACLETEARKAEIYLSTELVIRATRRHAPNNSRCNRAHHEIVLTIGPPNYAERQFIRWLKRAGEPLPVRKMQLHWYPKKKK
jgi:hypothetical protein